MDSGESSQERPVPTKKGKSKMPLKRKAAAALKQKSPAHFFAKNKKNAGFDKPEKALYATVRGLLENALDSAVAIGELPRVEVTIEEINRSKLNSMIGLIADATEKPLGKKGKKVKEATAREASILRVTCKDNGRGMPHDDIPNMFEPVLFGTLKQTREKFGLGAKMALIWSKMSTGIPVEISTSMKDQNYTSSYSLDIDMDTNMPNIHLREKRVDREKWHGAEIKAVIEGDWTVITGYEMKDYMRRMAVITPYAEIRFRFVAEKPKNDVDIMFERRVFVMPPVARETEDHYLYLMVKRLNGGSSDPNILEFLRHEFVNIGKADAERLIGEIMGPDVTSKTQVNSLTIKQYVCMQELFRKAAEFDDSIGEGCLIPIGEENLRLGIMGVIEPEMVATYSASFQVSGGHPFIMEAGVAIGGHLCGGLDIFRFANRVPLMLNERVDAVVNATNKFNWKEYKIEVKNKDNLDQVGVFVSILSTKNPKRPGMECIDDTTEIAHAVKVCLEKCCIQLKPQISEKINAARSRLFMRADNMRQDMLTGAISEESQVITRLTEELLG